jgi:hypothetical protein
MFEVGDQVVYTPFACDLLPIKERPWDIGIVMGIENNYIKVKFLNEYESDILPFGLIYHPQSVEGIRQQMRSVLQEMAGAVEGRMAALVFSRLTGHTAQRGFGPADILRSFLDPRPIRKHRHIGYH